MSYNNTITVEVARKIIYGTHAIERLPAVCENLFSEKLHLYVITGGTATRKIRENTILPLLENINSVEILELGKRSYEEEIGNLLESIHLNDGAAMIAAGGGRVMDITKVASCYTNVPWISIPTSASHDGFSSPFINYILRLAINDLEQEHGKFTPTAPLAIIGDTHLISTAGLKHLRSGFGDLLAKLSAVHDWELAHKIKGEYYDEYAAAFALVSARVAEEGYPLIRQAKEPGIRLMVKALGNSGVAMSIAGSSRPASGSEHLISHYLDYMAEKEQAFSNEKSSHGYQVGLATVLAMQLQGRDWQKVLDILQAVGHPTTFAELGIDADILLQAMLQAHTIRPDRYTILGDGLSKKIALEAIETTGVA